ncbi:hypothetical protein PENSPDRAFT_692834 [Peniophora sp. CONT]|nr:hypothetical protein PENSPDRAFT_692834 [Peniophora sp. CONT]
MLALAQLLQPHLSWPTYDSIRIGLRYNSGSFKLFTRGDDRQSPSVQLYLNDDVNFFEHVGQLSEFIIPHRITHLDVGSSCESRHGVSQALSLIAPSIQTIFITVHEGIVLDFLTDEDSSLDFSSLREIYINWPSERSAPEKGKTHWNGLRSWIERVGAKQLETLHLEGTNHYIDHWGLGRVLETLEKHKSKCRLVDKRVIYGARINYEPASGRREKWDWST